MEVKAKIILLEDGEKFMGPGVLWLLDEIEKTGSILKASASLGISYTKCYHMIDKAEKKLGFPLVDRKKGGSSREGVSLTAKGRAFASLFSSFENKSREKISEEYKTFSLELDRIKKEV